MIYGINLFFCDNARRLLLSLLFHCNLLYGVSIPRNMSGGERLDWSVLSGRRKVVLVRVVRVGRKKGWLGQSCQSGEAESLARSKLSAWGGREVGLVRVVSVGREKGWTGQCCQSGKGERLTWSEFSEWGGRIFG